MFTRREFSLNTQFAKIGPSMLEEFSISDRIWAGIYPLLREKHKENSDLIRLSGKNRYYSPSAEEKGIGCGQGTSIILIHDVSFIVHVRS